jgi:hypothetical protein
MQTTKPRLVGADDATLQRMAVQFARTVKLSKCIRPCPVTRELYGTTEAVVDRELVTVELRAAGLDAIAQNSEALGAACRELAHLLAVRNN